MVARSHIIMIAVAVVAALALVFLGIIPALSMSKKLDRDIARAKLMEKLAPYAQAVSFGYQAADKEVLEFTFKEPLPTEEVGGVAVFLRKMADKFNLEALEVKHNLTEPGADTSEAKEDLALMVDLRLKGSIRDMEQFLIQCAKLPFLKSVDGLALKLQEESLAMDVSLRFAVASSDTSG